MTQIDNFFLVEILKNKKQCLETKIIKNLSECLDYIHIIPRIMSLRFDREKEINFQYNNNLNLLPIQVCYLTKIPAGSKIGLSPVHVLKKKGNNSKKNNINFCCGDCDCSDDDSDSTSSDDDSSSNSINKYEILYPSFIDFLNSLFIQLALGNGNVCVYRDFITLPTKSFDNNADFEINHDFAAVDPILPTNINKLMADDITRNNIKKVLLYFTQKCIHDDCCAYSDTRLFEMFWRDLKDHCNLYSDIYEITSFYSYFADICKNCNDDEKSQIFNFYQIIVNNIMIAIQILKSLNPIEK